MKPIFALSLALCATVFSLVGCGSGSGSSTSSPTPTPTARPTTTPTPTPTPIPAAVPSVTLTNATLGTSSSLTTANYIGYSATDTAKAAYTKTNTAYEFHGYVQQGGTASGRVGLSGAGLEIHLFGFQPLAAGQTFSPTLTTSRCRYIEPKGTWLCNTDIKITSITDKQLVIDVSGTYVNGYTATVAGKVTFNSFTKNF